MRRLTSIFGFALAFVAAACAPDSPAQAQEMVCAFRGPHEALAERPSPLDSVMIDLGGDQAKLCYGRPSARGRVMVGGNDPYGRPWRMGANEPTTLHLGFAADLGGVSLDPGDYALYAIPTADEWTVVVNGNPDRWGIPISSEVRAADIGTIVVRPTSLDEPVETLTFSFEGVNDQEGFLVFAWEKRTFRIPLRKR